jgi:hypothetical protein
MQLTAEPDHERSSRLASFALKIDVVFSTDCEGPEGGSSEKRVKIP